MFVICHLCREGFNVYYYDADEDYVVTSDGKYFHEECWERHNDNHICDECCKTIPARTTVESPVIETPPSDVTKPIDEPLVEHTKLERIAKAKLSQAYNFKNKGKIDIYKKYLREIMEQYPGTTAAEEANTLLGN